MRRVIKRKSNTPKRIYRESSQRLPRRRLSEKRYIRESADFQPNYTYPAIEDIGVGRNAPTCVGSTNDYDYIIAYDTEGSSWTVVVQVAGACFPDFYKTYYVDHLSEREAERIAYAIADSVDPYTEVQRYC